MTISAVNVNLFLDKFTSWTSAQPDIEAVALVGSYARNDANEESDVDLIILTNQPERYLTDPSWASTFGEVRKSSVESWGRVQSLRTFYERGLEVEYSFALPEWADVPVDPGTNRVVSDGMKILFDPSGKLRTLERHQG